MKRTLSLAGLILSVTLLIASCASPTGPVTAPSPSPSEPAAEEPAATVIAPPQALVGTIALPDSSAVMTLNFSSSSASSRSIASRAIYTISGSIRYQGVDFAINGSYEDSTGAISATAETKSIGGASVTFTVLGVYSASDGFKGTIQRKSTTGGVLTTTKGTVAASPSTTATVSTSKNYLGVYSGSYGSTGTWNFTARDGKITGSYSGSNGGTTYGGTFSGTLTASTITVSSGTVINTDTGATLGTYSGLAKGTVDSNGLCSGTWANSGESGVWSGKQATASGDTTNGFTPATSIESEINKIVTLCMNGVNSIDMSGTSDPKTNGAGTASATNLSATTATFSFNSYTDGTNGTVTAGSFDWIGNAAVTPQITNREYTTTALTFSGTGTSVTKLEFDITANHTTKTLTGFVKINDTTDIGLGHFYKYFFP